MSFRSAANWKITAMGLALLAFGWPQTARAQVKLQYKFTEGKTFKTKATAKTHQILTLMGQEFENKENETVITSRSVGKRRSDGSVPVVEKVEAMRVDLSIPGGINIVYDSSDPNTKIDNPAVEFLGDVFKLVSEAVYTIVLDDQNKIKAIEGSEKLLEKADKLVQPARELIRSHFEADTLKRDFEQELRRLPDVLARPGDSWDRTEIADIGSGQTLVFQKKYEYAGTEKKGDILLDKITSKTTKVELKQDAATNPQLKILKSDVRIESADETILFDREEGQVASSQGKVRIKGDHMTFSAAGMELTGTLDLTIESNQERLPVGK
jgi:hypothetical protein